MLYQDTTPCCARDVSQSTIPSQHEGVSELSKKRNASMLGSCSHLKKKEGMIDPRES